MHAWGPNHRGQCGLNKLRKCRSVGEDVGGGGGGGGGDAGGGGKREWGEMLKIGLKTGGGGGRRGGGRGGREPNGMPGGAQGVWRGKGSSSGGGGWGGRGGVEVGPQAVVRAPGLVGEAAELKLVVFLTKPLTMTKQRRG